MRHLPLINFNLTRKTGLRKLAVFFLSQLFFLISWSDLVRLTLQETDASNTDIPFLDLYESMDVEDSPCLAFYRLYVLDTHGYGDLLIYWSVSIFSISKVASPFVERLNIGHTWMASCLSFWSIIIHRLSGFFRQFFHSCRQCDCKVFYIKIATSWWKVKVGRRSTVPRT